MGEKENLNHLSLKRLAGLPLDEFFAELKTSERGLKQEEAAERLTIYGPNAIPAERFEALRIFAEEVVTPFNLILVAAAALSFFLDSALEGGVIFAFFALSAGISFVEVYRANRAASALEQYLQDRVEVRRGGRLTVIDWRGIVKGDAVRVTAGDKVPADIRLISGSDLLLDESNLTGESQPVPKTPEIKEERHLAQEFMGNVLYGGSLVAQGTGEGIVVNAGSHSVFGEIARKTLAEHRKSPFQIILERFSAGVGAIALVGLVLVFSFNLILHRTPIHDLLIFSIVLGVSVVPEILSSVAAISFALASHRLAKRKIIVKRLSAVEDLGNIDVICTDKTGTLTENKLELKEIRSEDPDRFTLMNVLAYPYQRKYSELTQYSFEAALFNAGKQFHKEKKDESVVRRSPFHPETRTIETVIAHGGKTCRLKSGAPENVLSECGTYYAKTGKRRFTAGEIDDLRKEIKRQALSGLRIFASSLAEVSKKGAVGAPAFLGYATFADPLKAKAKNTIEKARELNVAVKILTGDSAEVAEYVAREVGILAEGEKAVSLDRLKGLSHAEFRDAVEKGSVFARVTPEWKHEIVKSLQERHFVGFLGEGINDALVLKTAHVAIALDRGADVSKEAADIILFDKDLGAIIEGVLEGRKTFTNISKYIKHTMADNFGNFCALGFLSVLSRFLPLTAVQVMLTNVLTDLPMVLIHEDNVDAEAVRKPMTLKMKDLSILLIVLGFLGGLSDFFIFSMIQSEPPPIIQTALFLSTTLGGLMIFYSIRTDRFFWQGWPSRTYNLITWVGMALTFLLTLTPFGRIFGFVELSLWLAAFILLYNVVILFVTDLAKKAALHFIKGM